MFKKFLVGITFLCAISAGVVSGVPFLSVENTEDWKTLVDGCMVKERFGGESYDEEYGPFVSTRTPSIFATEYTREQQATEIVEMIFADLAREEEADLRPLPRPLYPDFVKWQEDQS
jgi:hypothetical protein